MKKIRVMQIIPNPRDVTSFYRATGPFGQILCDYSNGIDITDEFPAEVFDEVAYRYRMAFMQRPYHDNHYEIAMRVKRNHRKLWIDFDDDLFRVPVDNPNFNKMADPKVRQNMAEVIMMADVVTVTTNHLKQTLQVGPAKDKDIRVIPNAFDFERFPEQPKKERNKLIMWRGSQTHTRDVLSVAQQLIESYKEFKGWDWEWLGDKQWMVSESMIQHDKDRCHFRDNMGIMEYHEHILQRAPKVFIVPLHNHSFNRSKSNIAFLESTYAGSLCLAPDFEEWRVPGCINYTDAKDFKDKLGAILNGKYDAQWEIARTWVSLNRNLQKVNEARVQIIKELSGVS